MHSPFAFRLFFVLVGIFVLSGCQKQLQLVSSVTTSYASSVQGNRDPKTTFGLNEVVIVYTYVSWPGADGLGGTHFVDWQWYRGNQMVSESKGYVRFGTSPAEIWAKRPAIALGAGDYRVATYVDGALLSTNAFTITSNLASTATNPAYDPKVAAQVCDKSKFPAVTAPPILHLAHPAFPAHANEAGVSGCVILGLTIDGAGHPAGIAVLAEYPTGWEFGIAAQDAAHAFVYAPNHPNAKDVRLVDFKSSPD